MNSAIADKVGSLFKSSIRFADTKRDVDLIKGLFARATSKKYVAKLLDVKTNKYSVISASDESAYKLMQFENIEMSSQMVRNDLTNEQQRRLTKRVIAERKHKYFKRQCETRGRVMKAELFLELKHVLEEIFNLGSNGLLGGLESHPRLTTGIPYKSRDNTL